MKKIFKQFDKVGLVVLLLTAMTVLGFKVSERMLAAEWYHVSLDASQMIEASYGTGVTPTFPCDEPLDGILCAVKIEILIPGTPMPASVADAELLKAQGRISLSYLYQEF